MCGICGIVKQCPDTLAPRVQRMNNAQAHRGPDGEGYYIAGKSPRVTFSYSSTLETESLCALGHRRLAILDPDRGAQPMGQRGSSNRRTAQR